jgi:aminoglycoside phosphotransferase (APT) family kinase protein
MRSPGAAVGPVREEHRFDERALHDYLKVRLPELSGDLEILQFDSGQSNPTFLLSLLSASGRRYVLRKKPPGELLPKAHQVEREYRVMEALASTDVPVPRVLLLCEDPSVIGTSFFVMEHLEGRHFWDASLPELAPDERRAVHEEMVRVLATLHGVDYESRGLTDFGKRGSYFERQLSRWIRQYRASQTEEIASMERLIEWLPVHLPEDDSTALVHGDYRIDNVIFHPERPRALGVLDWELSTLGHPLADLAYLCQVYHVETPYQRALAGAAGTESGIPTEMETVELYCRLTGRSELSDWSFYVAFSMFRLAAIAQGVYRRGLDGNASSTRALELGRLVRIEAEAACKLLS